MIRDYKKHGEFDGREYRRYPANPRVMFDKRPLQCEDFSKAGATGKERSNEKGDRTGYRDAPHGPRPLLVATGSRWPNRRKSL